jgi:hypothetical protein
LKNKLTQVFESVFLGPDRFIAPILFSKQEGAQHDPKNRIAAALKRYECQKFTCFSRYEMVTKMVKADVNYFVWRC